VFQYRARAVLLLARIASSHCRQLFWQISADVGTSTNGQSAITQSSLRRMSFAKKTAEIMLKTAAFRANHNTSFRIGTA
jgi:hypothetical protein